LDGWTAIRTSRQPAVGFRHVDLAEPVRHWVAVRRGGTLLAARTLRCQGDYRSAAAATVLLACQLTSRQDPLPAGVLVPEEVLTVDELEPGLDRVGITVADQPTGARGPQSCRLDRSLVP
jgi:hypothetical protein